MYKYLKRIIDCLATLTALVIFLTPLIILAILIKLESKGPVLFKQVRLDKNGIPIKIWKFHSICVGAEMQGTGPYSYKGDTSITKVRKIIRSTNIDERPQLVNILKGDIAFIGPRPALTYHSWPYDNTLNIKNTCLMYTQM